MSASASHATGSTTTRWTSVFDVPTSSVALAVSTLLTEKNKIFMNSAPAAPTSPARPAHRPSSTTPTTPTRCPTSPAKRWSSAARTPGSSSPPTTPSASARARRRQCRQGERRQGPRRRSPPAQYLGLLLVPAAGAGLEGQGGRARQCRRRHHERPEAGRRIRPYEGRPASSIALLLQITDVHSHRPQGRPGPASLPTPSIGTGTTRPAPSPTSSSEKVGHMPTMIQAGLYSATMHYLQAIDAIGTDDTAKVMAQMRATPINDFFTKNGHIREDGRMVHDMYLFEVKKPSELKGEWDLYKLLATVPADQAFRPLDKGDCPLVSRIGRAPSHRPRNYRMVDFAPWNDVSHESAPGGRARSCCDPTRAVSARELELRHRLQPILGGVEDGMVGIPWVGLRRRRGAGACSAGRRRRRRRLAVGRARAGGAVIGDRLGDELDLVEGNGDQMCADAEEAADADNGCLRCSRSCRSELVDSTDTLIAVVIDVETNDLRGPPIALERRRIPCRRWRRAARSALVVEFARMQRSETVRNRPNRPLIYFTSMDFSPSENWRREYPPVGPLFPVARMHFREAVLATMLRRSGNISSGACLPAGGN